MDDSKRNHVTDKEQLYIKLFIFSLKRTKEFILSQYDDELAIQISACRLENFQMLVFCFSSLNPDFFEENIIRLELKNAYESLIKEMKQIATSRELYQFAKNEINGHLLFWQSFLNKMSQ